MITVHTMILCADSLWCFLFRQSHVQLTAGRVCVSLETATSHLVSKDNDYKQGKELHVAHTLSWPPVIDNLLAANVKQEYEAFWVEIAEMDIQPNRVTSEIMRRIKQGTAKDPILAPMRDEVATG